MAAASRPRRNLSWLAGLVLLMGLAALATRPAPPAHAPGPAIDADGDIYQYGVLAGRASSATLLRTDPTIVAFERISAARLHYTDEFQYSGYVLRIVRIREVDYSSIPGARPQPTLLRVEAKIQRRGELVRLEKSGQ